MSTRSRIAKPLRGQVLPVPCGGATFACHTPSRRKTVTLYALWSKGRRRTTPRRTFVANVWHVCFLQIRREPDYAQCTGRFRLTTWLQECHALLSSTRLCQCTCGRAPAKEVRARVADILRDCLRTHNGSFDPSQISHKTMGLSAGDERTYKRLNRLLQPGQLRAPPPPHGASALATPRAAVPDSASAPSPTGTDAVVSASAAGTTGAPAPGSASAWLAMGTHALCSSRAAATTTAPSQSFYAA